MTGPPSEAPNIDEGELMIVVSEPAVSDIEAACERFGTSSVGRVSGMAFVKTSGGAETWTVIIAREA